MDSWSRPSKSQATPAPFYLTQGDDVPYCHSCGRVIGQRRANSSKTSSTEVKYCSDRCKRNKPSTGPKSIDSRIHDALVALLKGLEPPKSVRGEAEDDDVEAEQAALKAAKAKKAFPKKGDPRIIVQLSQVGEAVFGNRQNPEKVYGRNKNRYKRGVPDAPEWKSVDMEDPSSQPPQNDPDDSWDSGSETADEVGGVPINVRPPQNESDVNFSVGGERGWSEKIDETPEMLQRRREGQKRAEEQEVVKRAARRAVVFGLLVNADEVEVKSGKGGKGKRKKHEVEHLEADAQVRKKCEALMHGAVVEPSFAKGDWSIRWRED
ncbi:hypothetical protein MBLNU230_g1123t1 [Neophaeotheca triangularis]